MCTWHEQSIYIAGHMIWSLSSYKDMSALYYVGKLFQIFALQLLKDLRPYWLRSTFGINNLKLSLNAYVYFLRLNIALN